MEQTAVETLCPACGYSRVGIALDARCPECGADGFANAFVVEGTSVRPGLSPRIVGTIAVMVAVFTIFVTLTMGADPELALIMLIACAGGAIWSVREIRRTDGKPRAVTATWLIHPRGVVIRARGTQRRIPIEAIAAIHSADSLVGAVTQVSIRVRLVSSQTLSWRPILYLQGSSDERRSNVSRMRQTLSL